MQSTNADELELLSARDTAARLGVKLDTLYAYVSRGLIRSVGVPGSRERGYLAGDVERFRASRGLGRGMGRADSNEALVPVIDSAISLIDNGRFYYRGVDAIGLAEAATLEEVAGLLWGEFGVSASVNVPHAPTASRRVPPSPRIAPTLPSPASGGGLGRGRGEGWGEGQLGLIERCQIRLAMLAAQNPAALDLTRHGVVRTGSTILYELAAAVGTGNGEAASVAGPVHRQLAAHWRLDAAGADLVRRCLVLLADHELNASTFVARCVASTGATPYAVASGALSALSGRRHGGASARAEALFHEIGQDNDPMAVMAARLARDEGLPGLGQPLYPDGDPRALAIVEAVAKALPEAGARIAAAAAAAHQLTGQYANVDFALGAAVTALGLPPGAALGLFVVGRTVGWIAHAIEQYESRILIRPRARYIGKRPTGL
jgi:citrate synthase